MSQNVSNLVGKSTSCQIFLKHPGVQCRVSIGAGSLGPGGLMNQKLDADKLCSDDDDNEK